MSHLPIEWEELLKMSLAHSRTDYDCYQRLLNLEDDITELELLRVIYGQHRHKAAVVKSSDVCEMERFKLFVKNVNKDECKAFPLLWVDPNRDVFIVFKIKQNVCDTIVKKNVIKIRTLYYLNGRIRENIYKVKTSHIKGRLRTLANIVVHTEGEEIAEKFFNTGEKYVCGYCGEIGEKMKKCSVCMLVYYCNGKCQKKNWKLHQKVCGK